MNMPQRWTVADIPDQSGRVAVVTGANSGLGYETALALAGKGARVVMACRKLAKGQAAREAILDRHPAAELDLRQLDVASLDSVRDFAGELSTAYPRIDLLINNAGVMAIPRSESPDGFEMQFATNHLGPFALTGLLLEPLLAAPASRIVTISSIAAFIGRMPFADLQGVRSYDRNGQYAMTKLANLLFAFELQRRLARLPSRTISVAAHPGYANTQLQSTSYQASGSPIERMIYQIGANFGSQSAAMGALPQLYAATAPGVEGGDYIGPQYFHLRGYPRKVTGPAIAYDPQAAARLWQISEELSGVRYKALEVKSMA